MQNNGALKFEEVYNETTGAYWGSIECGDFNNDGFSDVLINGHGNNIQGTFVLKNDSSRTFELLDLNLTSTHSGGAHWGKLAKGNNLDIYIHGTTSGSSSDATSDVFQNNSTINNDPPSTPSNLRYEIIEGRLQVYWNNSEDDKTKSSGLFYNVELGDDPNDFNIINGQSTTEGSRKVMKIGNNGTKTFFRFPSLARGTYYFRVQAIDNGFNASPYSDVLVIRNTPITLPDSLSICEFDSVLLDPGTFSSYAWSTGESTQTIYAQKEGWYSVNVENVSGYQSTDSTYVQVSALPKPSLPDSLSICEFDSVLLDPGNFSTYIWSTGQSAQGIYVTSEGWYSVLVENSSGCIATDSTFIQVNSLPKPLLPDSISICEFDSVLLDPGTFSSYSWSTGHTNQTIFAKSEGWHSVLVRNSLGCLSSDSVFISTIPLPIINIGDTSIFHNDVIQISLVDFEAFLMMVDSVDNYSKVTADTLAKEGHIYSVKVTIENDCSTEIYFNINIEEPLMQEDTDALFALRYSNNYVIIKNNSKAYTWKVISLDGRSIKEGRSKHGEETRIVLTGGLYILVIETENSLFKKKILMP